MNNPHEDLIEELDSCGNIASNIDQPRIVKALDDARDLLRVLHKSQHFVPIQHLMDGGVIVNPRGDSFKIDPVVNSSAAVILIKHHNSEWWQSIGYDAYTLIESLSHNSFKPHKQPRDDKL